jgi:hypothetical protein
VQGLQSGVKEEKPHPEQASDDSQPDRKKGASKKQKSKAQRRHKHSEKEKHKQKRNKVFMQASFTFVHFVCNFQCKMSTAPKARRAN